MNRWIKGAACAAMVGLAARPAAAEDAAMTAKDQQSVHDFTLNGIDGKPVALAGFRGRTLLVVNLASRCGLTPQYAGLEKLYRAYKDRGFAVLGFPANNFMGQEPGTDEEIRTFCTTKYDVTFPLFSKISVKGADQHPLYRFLTAADAGPDGPGDIGWNFAKFIVGPDGRVLHRFSPRTAPDDARFVAALEAALGD